HPPSPPPAHAGCPPRRRAPTPPASPLAWPPAMTRTKVARNRLSPPPPTPPPRPRLPRHQTCGSSWIGSSDHAPVGSYIKMGDLAGLGCTPIRIPPCKSHVQGVHFPHGRGSAAIAGRRRAAASRR